MDLTKIIGEYSGEVDIGDDEVHSEARRPSKRIAMTLQERRYCRNIVRGFEAVKVIRALAEQNTGGAQFVPAFSITHADSSPIVTLQDDYRTVKCITLNRKERAP